MRQLLLLRHAKSSWDDPALEDHARPLNPRGRQTAGALREVLRNLNIVPDLILVSSARRTLQTLEALEPWDETPLIEPMDRLYLASAADLLAVLGETAETVRSVMLIGHNPGLHELSLRLIGDAQPDDAAARTLAHDFPTGGLAEFTVPSAWAALADGGARLDRFIDPRELTGS